MKSLDNNPQAKIVFTFAFAVAALVCLIFASLTEMPLRAIFIAIAFSDIIFLAVILLGNKLPGGKSGD